VGLEPRLLQPGEGVLSTFEGVVLQLEAVAECDSIEQVYERLEGHRVMTRLDRSVRPSMLKGATASLGELGELRRIDNVVRLGHVERIQRDTINLQQGSIPTSPGHLHIHCASAGLIGLVEASGRSTAEKNRLCRPNAWIHTPFDWTRHLLTGLRTEMEWQDAPDVLAWMDTSRLNLVKGLDQHPDQAALADLQRRFLTALFPALAKLDEFASCATPAERARMFEPTG
jgi:hypothetical protein